ncbi:MAG: hypothetical protein LBR55_07590 [Bacteroidales bacterium]|jgi:hypothetical protein|nr:hypothetical protein [Bacteroidales bacterium]
MNKHLQQSAISSHSRGHLFRTSMKKIIVLVSIPISVSIFVSCKKCKSCDSWKNGRMDVQENCSYGFPPSKQGLDVWDEILVEKFGYDSVKCVMK